jgi:DNA ligase-1
MRLRFASLFLTLCIVSFCTPLLASELAAPPVMLANLYHDDIVLSEYWVSEKFDGVRAYWDGEKLLTRGGERIMAPTWFTAGWPSASLDGELWVARGQFSAAVSIVRQQPASDEQWRTIKFMAFDLPNHGGTFNERNIALKQIVALINQPWLLQVSQNKVANKTGLHAELLRVTNNGGEGLVLHRGSSLYQAVRNDDLLKLKLFDDAEATVVKHLAGRGKFTGMLGALEVVNATGLHFELGTGFSDEERRHPPPIGCLVTFRFNGLNEKSGVPRFARFMRIRDGKL